MTTDGPTLLPDAFRTAMEEQFGVSELADFERALRQPVPVSVHRNILKKIHQEENTDGVKWYSNGVYLPKRPRFTLDPLFHAGAYYVQEASSMFLAEVVQQLGFERPIRALDLCGAPGGKSTLLATNLPAGSLLVANEVIRSRYQVLQYNLYKWAYPNVVTTPLDSKQYRSLAGFFDLVLVDAPCSGEGLFRRDPAAIEEWSPAHVQHCSLRQQRILADAAELVRPGGFLVYSTCTFNHAENGSNASWLLHRFPFERYPIDVDASWNILELPFGLQFLPHRVRGEGLFLSVFHRRGDFPDVATQKTIPFKHLLPLNRSHQPLVSSWIQAGADYHFFTDKASTIFALPESALADVQQLAAHLPRIDLGFPIGQIKGKQLIPHPALAFQPALAPTIPRLEVDRDTALQLLRKATPALPNASRGWQLITYENLGLLWIKGLGNRYNNYYPKEWRIRLTT